jgi:hypothetical protein
LELPLQKADVAKEMASDMKELLAQAELTTNAGYRQLVNCVAIPRCLLAEADCVCLPKSDQILVKPQFKATSGARTPLELQHEPEFNSLLKN